MDKRTGRLLYGDGVTDIGSVRLFAFDFDGTLVQSNAIKRQAFYQVTKDIEGSGVFLDQLFLTEPDLDRYQIFSRVAEYFELADGAPLAAEYGRYCEDAIRNAPEVPGALSLLKRIAAKGAISALNSATPEQALQDLMKGHAFEPYLSEILGSPRSKADNLRILMAKYNLTPDQLVMVGDREPDRISAEETGCGFIGVEGDMRDFVKEPARVVTHLDEVQLG